MKQKSFEFTESYYAAFKRIELEYGPQAAIDFISSIFNYVFKGEKDDFNNIELSLALELIMNDIDERKDFIPF